MEVDLNEGYIKITINDKKTENVTTNNKGLQEGEYVLTFAHSAFARKVSFQLMNSDGSFDAEPQGDRGAPAENSEL